MSLFSGIEKFRGQLSSIALTVAFLPDGNLSIVVNPDPADGAKDKSLSANFGVQGSAEELDAAFVSAIGSFASTRLSLTEQIEAQKTALAASAKAAMESKKPPKAVKSTAKSVNLDDNNDDEPDDISGSVPAKALPGPVEAASTTTVPASSTPVVTGIDEWDF